MNSIAWKENKNMLEETLRDYCNEESISFDLEKRNLFDNIIEYYKDKIRDVSEINSINMQVLQEFVKTIDNYKQQQVPKNTTIPSKPKEIYSREEISNERNKDFQNKFQSVQKEFANFKLKKPEEIDFSDNVEEDELSIDKKIEMALKERQYDLNENNDNKIKKLTNKPEKKVSFQNINDNDNINTKSIFDKLKKSNISHTTKEYSQNSVIELFICGNLQESIVFNNQHEKIIINNIDIFSSDIYNSYIINDNICFSPSLFYVELNDKNYNCFLKNNNSFTKTYKLDSDVIISNNNINLNLKSYNERYLHDSNTMIYNNTTTNYSLYNIHDVNISNDVNINIDTQNNTYVITFDNIIKNNKEYTKYNYIMFIKEYTNELYDIVDLCYLTDKTICKKQEKNNNSLIIKYNHTFKNDKYVKSYDTEKNITHKIYLVNPLILYYSQL